MMRPSPVIAKEGSPQETAQLDTVIVFFYLVNRSGQDAMVRVLADDRGLFVQEIESKQEAPVGAEEAPPPGPYPARELKVPLNRKAKRLEVEELNSGMKAQFEITNFIKVDAGFRITIGARQILLDQDYFPVR